MFYIALSLSIGTCDPDFHHAIVLWLRYHSVLFLFLTIETEFLVSLSDTSGHIIECQDKNSKSCDFAPKLPVLYFANNTD